MAGPLAYRRSPWTNEHGYSRANPVVETFALTRSPGKHAYARRGRNGHLSPVKYVSRTAAERAALRLGPGWVVYQPPFGVPFYVVQAAH